MITIYNKSCYGLSEIANNSIDSIITDPPYGIKLEQWDNLPDEKIWADCFRVLKPGGYLLCFSSIKYQHIITQQILNNNFILKDVLLWIYLNGRVPAINVDKKIDDYLGNERTITGYYNYVQGSPNSKKKSTYKNNKKPKTIATKDSELWVGFGTGLKTAYEPIIMFQKPYENTLAENILKYNVGALNIDETRIPYLPNETPTGHNPHPKGRVMSNIIQTEEFGDYQKFFFVGKVRDGKKTGNIHPTSKPVDLMNCLINLVSKENDIVLDPFMGSGSTGVSSIALSRHFVGYELEKTYFDIANKRISELK